MLWGNFQIPFLYSLPSTTYWRLSFLHCIFLLGFPCGSAGKESSCNAGDLGSIPGLGRSPGEGKGGYPLQYSGLDNSMDCSLPGFSVHRIFQARVLEWVAISFSRGSSQPRNWTQVSRIAGRHIALWACLGYDNLKYWKIIKYELAFQSVWSWAVKHFHLYS